MAQSFSVAEQITDNSAGNGTNENSRCHVSARNLHIESNQSCSNREGKPKSNRRSRNLHGLISFVEVGLIFP